MRLFRGKSQEEIREITFEIGTFNYIVWPKLKDFVVALLEFQMLRLVPREALFIKSYGNSVLFESLRPQDATPTSFSAYNEYGILLGLLDNYYTLPKGSFLLRISSFIPSTIKIALSSDAA